MKTSKMNDNLITAHKKGYRIIKGKIFYKKRRINGKIGSVGYRLFAIRNFNGERRDVFVHRLVAYQKYGRRIFKKGIQVRHHDGNKLNNLPNNILIGTALDNYWDKKLKTRNKVMKSLRNAVKKYNHKKIIKLFNNGFNYEYIMKTMNIKSKGTISFIINKSIDSKFGELRER